MMLSSYKNKILVVGDVHQDVATLKKIMNHEAPGMTVCTGDWFDSRIYNTAVDVTLTCDFLKEHILSDDFESLVGNHDLPYLYNNQYTICTGYSKAKDKYIKEALGDYRNILRHDLSWYIWVDDYLLTHAGLHAYFLSTYQTVTNKELLSKWIREQGDQAEIHLSSGSTHWLYRAGAARLGQQKYGGITWLDFKQEMEPIEGLKQIVGHTSHRHITALDQAKLDPDNVVADNLCVDTGLAEYLIILNGKVQIKKTIDI